MSNIFVGPVGSVCKGNVLDVNVKAFENTLKFYDPLLYIKWNPRKLRGWGCWEIRRKPSEKRPVDYAPIEGGTIVRYEAAENDLVNHVLDCAFLNYDALRKLKEMDTYNKDHWWHDSEYILAKKQEAAEAKAIEELKYNIRYNRNAINQFMELVRSGMNPAQVLTSMKWVY